MKRLLWIVPKWPLPASDGARQATTQLLSGLCSKGVAIDLLAIIPQGEKVAEEEAIEALEQAGASATPLVQAMALYRLGSLYSTLGQHEEAAATFGRLGDNPPAGFPADEARFARAQAQEAAGDAQAALMTYRTIADGDAASIYAMPARVKAEELAARLGVELDSES